MKSRTRATILANAEKLALTLRCLASGQSMQNIAIYFRLGHTTAHKLIIEVCKEIWIGIKDAAEYVKWPSTPAESVAVNKHFRATPGETFLIAWGQ